MVQNSNMNKKLKKSFGHFLMFVIIIITIAVIFITVGWAANKLLREEKPLTLSDKKKRLKLVEKKILELQAKKEEIRARENRILLVSRLFIAMGLLLANYYFMKHYKIAFDLKKSSNELLRFNSVLVLVYSFVAFVSYGTPAKFMESLKSIITSLLQKFNIETFSGYEKLLSERGFLVAEIEIEEKRNHSAS